ncbi:MAG: low affinity iron permease family protein [Actinomycetota bacterium]|nr:low affinity iron permease family protein [Actinomycetota bacterium]
MPGADPTPAADVSDQKGWFDHVADTIQDLVAKPTFCLCCMGLVLVWAVVGPFVNYTHRWVDLIQTTLGLVTFFLVLLLQNDVWRTDKATQRKLNAIAGALANLMEAGDLSPEHVGHLNAAVGLEKRESTSR